jgi:hypothetical protein
MSVDLMAMVTVMNGYTDPVTGTVEAWHPIALATLANASDSPNFLSPGYERA